MDNPQPASSATDAGCPDLNHLNGNATLDLTEANRALADANRTIDAEQQAIQQPNKPLYQSAESDWNINNPLRQRSAPSWKKSSASAANIRR